MDGKTVFVVGAGASKEFDLPTGDELRDIIAEMVVTPATLNGLNFGTNDYAEILRFKVAQHQKYNPQFDASGMFQAITSRRGEIVAALPYAPSIDNFLHLHKKDELMVELGKLAISESILIAESKSKLREESGFIARRSSASWLNELGKWLFPLQDYSQLPSRLSKIAFVCFNYDRCIEQFFAYAISSLYRRPLAEARALTRKINIYHPYGSLGQIPLENEFGDGLCGFGKRPTIPEALALTNRIRTFTETVEEGEDLEAAREQLRMARQIVFMGFAFHELNLDLLFPQTGGYNENAVLTGTMYNMSESEARIIGSQLKRTFRPNVFGAPDDKYYDIKCAEFMRREGRDIFSRVR